MDNFTSVDTSNNMSLIVTEKSSLFHNDTISLNFTNEEEAADGADLPTLAAAYITYKIGDFLSYYYLPVMLIIGIIGNILSFLVMIQRHNRHLPMSWYLASIALVDTFILFNGCTVYLTLAMKIELPMTPLTFCKVTITDFFMANLASTLFIMSMTFDRFYSIIQPHKAASFNTVKRAKKTIVCILIFSISFNVPHIFTTSHIGWLCLPFGDVPVMEKPVAEFYYWLSFTTLFIIPFCSLLTMNSFIIHTLRNRLNLQEKQGQNEGQGKGQSQGPKLKTSDKQIFAILLLVTFAFMILTTPGYLFFLVNLLVDFTTSPRLFAGYHLFTNAVQKLHYTNHGINFFLYVISGQKFRNDLKRLFGIEDSQTKEKSNSSSNNDFDTKITTIEIRKESLPVADPEFARRGGER